MVSRLAIVLVAALAFAAPVHAAAAESTKFIGTTGAHGELRADALRLIAPFGGEDCLVPSEVRVGMLNASMISPNASYYSPALGTTYERWDAKFCGKVERLMVKFAPDPAGGTFILVEYPYPSDAPSGF